MLLCPSVIDVLAMCSTCENAHSQSITYTSGHDTSNSALYNVTVWTENHEGVSTLRGHGQGGHTVCHIAEGLLQRIGKFVDVPSEVV